MHSNAGRIHCPKWECRPTADRSHPRGIDFRAEECSSWQKPEYAVSWFEEGPGRRSAPISVRLVKCSQHAFRNFHLNTGLAVRGQIGFIGCINDGLCWDFGKGSRMVRCGNGPASFTNSRSVFVPVFHLRQWKLSVCLGSCNRFKPEAEAQSSSASPDALIER